MRRMAAHPASPGSGAQPPAPPPDLDLAGLEAEARRHIDNMAYAYYAGGAEDERLLAENVAAWSRWQLLPRVMTGVSGSSARTTLLGTSVGTPVGVAPTALQALAHRDGERATAAGAAAADAVMVLSSLSTTSLEDVASSAPRGVRWMQVYIQRDRERTADMVRRAAGAGYTALVLTVDAPTSGLRRRELREHVHLPADLRLVNLAGAGDAAKDGGFMAMVAELDPAITPEDIGWLHDVSGLPVCVKGILRPDDARRCVGAGAAGIVVSNHGGRQLDDAPATADVLCGVADAVGGEAEILVDGGIRRGPDVVKAIALGAGGVLIGRPALWALAAGGDEGVAQLLRWLTQEVERTLLLCGAASLSDLDHSVVRQRGEGVK